MYATSPVKVEDSRLSMSSKVNRYMFTYPLAITRKLCLLDSLCL